MNVKELAGGILSGDRRSLSKAITLIESTRPEDESLSDSLFSELSAKKTESIRIGISGVPGAGKSTFIESLGLFLLENKKKLAVLAVDPSSPLSGGSILGDKTRMQELTRSKDVFIRPSPSSGSLGGVAKKTYETIELCEKAGYEIIIIETVGVGQSEVAVSDLCDLFLLILLSGAGDDLQGIKKGVMEMADIIIVNKADGKGKTSAELYKSELEGSLEFIKPRHDFWRTKVITTSALENRGIKETWALVGNFFELGKEKLKNERARQKEKWMYSFLESKLSSRLKNLLEKNSEVIEILKATKSENLSAREAATKIIDKLFQR